MALELTSDGLLPVAVHPATLDEVEKVFVDAAPFMAQRGRIFRALVLYAEVVWERLPEAVLWVDGGFVTHKDWEAPHDADVAVLAAGYSPNDHPDDAHLWTLQGVSVEEPMLDFVKRVQPMGGLIDGFFVPSEVEAAVDWWRQFWQRLRRPGLPDLLNAKGFVEVRRS
jgi:hypothetical protein